MFLLAPFAALIFGGCGIVEKDLSGSVRFSWDIDDEDDTYDSIEQFDPNSNEDVKEHRDNIQDGQVVKISIEITSVQPTNEAKFVAGQVDVRVAGAGDDAWISAVGKWDGIPVYDEDGNPALQPFTLELARDTRDELSRIVFEEESLLDFRLNGVGYDAYFQKDGPVRISGDVVVEVEATYSAP
jgi:hypothetical protein